MMRGIINKRGKEETVQSYLGMLGKGNTKKLRNKIFCLVDEMKVI